MGATSTPIQTGRTEEIRLNVNDVTGVPLTGASGVLIRIQRASDDFYYDFNDATFKSSGWVDRDTVLAEVDAVLLPGIYELTGGFDTGAVTNLSDNDTYLVFPVNSGAGDTVDAVLPGPGEFKVGFFADDVDLVAFTSATINSAIPGTLELAGWLVRNADVVISGLVSATIEIQDDTGAVIVASAAMSGPTAAGVFRRSVPGVTLAAATNYFSILAIVDSIGSHTSITALPTLG